MDFNVYVHIIVSVYTYIHYWITLQEKSKMQGHGTEKLLANALGRKERCSLMFPVKLFVRNPREQEDGKGNCRQQYTCGLIGTGVSV